MIRNFKLIGWTVLMALLTCAVTATAASAAPKLTIANGEYPALELGTQTGKHVFTLPGNRKIECTTAVFAGEIGSKSQAETSKITVAPLYQECVALILGNVTPATVTMNECAYVLAVEEAGSGSYEYEGSLEIQCVVGSRIDIQVTEVKTGSIVCTYEIGGQGPLTTMGYRLNEKNGAGEATTGTFNAEVTGMGAHKEFGTLTNCGAKEQTATYSGNSLVEWGNENGEMIKAVFDPS